MNTETLEAHQYYVWNGSGLVYTEKSNDPLNLAKEISVEIDVPEPPLFQSENDHIKNWDHLIGWKR